MTNKRVEIKIPETLNDFTLEQYIEISKLDEIKDAGEQFYTDRVLSIVFGLNDIKTLNLKNKDISLMIDSVREVLTQEPKFENRFSMSGIDYGFIPNLDEITFGELIDLDKFSEDNQIDKIMGVLYRPIIGEQQGKRYEIKKYEGNPDYVARRQMPLGIALGALGFFLTLGLQLIDAIQRSLTAEEVEQIRSKILGKNGDGTPHSIH